MDHSRGLGLLARGFRGEPPPEDAWLEVLELANRSLVTPRLALALASAEGLPEDVQRFLADVLARNRRRNAALVEQLDEAACALNGEGIFPVLLKGAAGLAGGGPAQRDGRMLCDLDLLVAPQEVERAVQALERIGYQLFSRRFGGDLHVVAELVRDGDWAMIDLHQRPPGPPAMAEAPGLRDGAARLRLDAGVARVPEPAVQLYLLMLHDQFHDGDYWSGRLNLRHLLDIRDLLAAPGGVDWGRLDGLVRTAVARNALDTLLIDARWLAGAAVPEARLRRLWPRLQHWRRLQQVSRPNLMMPFAVATALTETSNLLAHRREDRSGRRRLFGEGGGARSGAAGAWLSSRLERMRDIFAVPAAGKL